MDIKNSLLQANASFDIMSPEKEFHLSQATNLKEPIAPCMPALNKRFPSWYSSNRESINAYMTTNSVPSEYRPWVAQALFLKSMAMYTSYKNVAGFHSYAKTCDDYLSGLASASKILAQKKKSYYSVSTHERASLQVTQQTIYNSMREYISYFMPSMKNWFPKSYADWEKFKELPLNYRMHQT